jgi:hypothetical protein
VKPWLLGAHPKFPLARKAFFSAANNPNEPALGWFWAGGAGTSEQGAYLDFTNPAAVSWWKQVGFSEMYRIRFVMLFVVLQFLQPTDFSTTTKSCTKC